MANNENLIPIPGRLHSVTTEGITTGADEIFDDTQQKDQETINSELIAAVGTGGSVDSRIAAAINALDATKSQNAGVDGLALNITEVDGKITSISGSIAANTYDANGAAAAAKSEVLGSGVGTDYNTLKKIEDKLSPIETAVGTGGSIDQRIEDATEDCAYLGENDGSAVIADFDPQTDTVWKKAQTLSNADKSQVKTNLGIPQEIYSKAEVNELVSTPHQNYVTVATYSELPASGSTDTIYRVSNYDGTQVATGVYSEYAWNGSNYVFLAAKSSVGEVFDISEYHAGAKYADLAAALDSNNGGGIPQSLQKGGMSVKFVQTDDNKYVQWRLMANQWSTTESDWQGVDDEPVSESINLVKSGGTFNRINKLREEVSYKITIYDNFLSLNNGQNNISFSLTKGEKYKLRIVNSDSKKVVIYSNTQSTYNPDTIKEITTLQATDSQKEVYFIPDRDSTYLYIWTSASCSIELVIEKLTPCLEKLDKDLYSVVFVAKNNYNLSQGQNNKEFSLSKDKRYKITAKSSSGERISVFSNTQSTYSTGVICIITLDSNETEKTVEFTPDRDSTYLYIWTSGASSVEIDVEEYIPKPDINSAKIEDFENVVFSEQTIALFGINKTLTTNQNFFAVPFKEGNKYHIAIQKSNNVDVDVQTTLSNNYQTKVDEIIKLVGSDRSAEFDFIATGDANYLYIWRNNADVGVNVEITKYVTIDDIAQTINTQEVIIPTTSNFIQDFRRSWTNKNNSYESWPYGNVCYDATRNRIVCFYMVQSGHAYNDCGVYMRYKQNGIWSDAIAIAPSTTDPEEGDTICYCTNTFWIDSNGYYHILLWKKYGGYFYTRGDIYYHSISTDGGLTWTNNRLVVDGENVGTYDGGIELNQINKAFKTSTGRIIVLCSIESTGNIPCFIYSDDNGETWSKTAYVSGGKIWSENDYVELNGKIYTFMRESWSAGVTDYYSISTDNGITWSEPVQLDIDMDSCNYVFIHDKSNKIVYVVFGSRTVLDDGKRSIYLSKYTESVFESLVWKQGYRISKVSANYGDFGYFGLAFDNQTGVFDVITYYQDPIDGACICESENSLI